MHPHRPRVSRDREAARVAAQEASRIDALYGLEPVYEPGGERAGAIDEFVELRCPYCAQRYATSVDLTMGARAYVEDCPICCHPTEIRIAVDARGELASVSAARLD